MKNPLSRISTYIGTGLLLLVPNLNDSLAYNVPGYLEESNKPYKSRQQITNEQELQPAQDMFIPFPLELPQVPFKIANEKPEKLDEINLDPPTKGIIKKARINAR